MIPFRINAHSMALHRSAICLCADIGRWMDVDADGKILIKERLHPNRGDCPHDLISPHIFKSRQITSS
jgi:hypothetical protein